MVDGQDAAVAQALGVGRDAPADETKTDASEQDQAQEAETIEDLPNWAAEEIRRLRRENASKRVLAREQARREQSNGQPPEASTQAIKAAEDRGRQAAKLEYGIQLAGAELRASLADTFTREQITDIMDDLNLGRCVKDDGEVDTEMVSTLKDKYLNLVGKRPVARVNHGRVGSTAPKTNADLFGDWLTSAGG